MKLKKELIKLNCNFNTKEEAIKEVANIFEKEGITNNEYYNSMIERDKLSSVFIGNGVAIPHGTEEGKDSILKTDVIVLQVPKGVDFDGNKAYLVIGIAAKNDEHMDILTNIAISLSEEEETIRLSKVSTVEEIIKGLSA